MTELVSLAGKIEEVERTLQQEEVEAVSIVKASEGAALDFCRRLLLITRVVLEDKKDALPNRGWRVIVCSLLAKTIGTVRAAYTLARAGNGREVSILVRSALESLIIATFVAKKDSTRRAKRWAQYAILLKARLLEKHPDLSTTPEQKKAAAKILAHAKRLERVGNMNALRRRSPRPWAPSG
jgi:hypothetical protein